VYLTAPFLGAVIAALTYRFLRGEPVVPVASPSSEPELSEEPA
jgi:hypothetical protein